MRSPRSWIRLDVPPALPGWHQSRASRCGERLCEVRAAADAALLSSALRLDGRPGHAFRVAEIGPEDFHFRRDHWVSAENSTSLEINAQVLEHDDVRSYQKEGLGEVIAGFCHSIEKLPASEITSRIDSSVAG